MIAQMARNPRGNKSPSNYFHHYGYYNRRYYRSYGRSFVTYSKKEMVSSGQLVLYCPQCIAWPILVLTR